MLSSVEEKTIELESEEGENSDSEEDFKPKKKKKKKKKMKNFDIIKSIKFEENDWKIFENSLSLMFY